MGDQKQAPWRIERVVTADLSGAGAGAAHGGADAGAIADLGVDDGEHEFGPTHRYRELARTADATLAVSFADHDSWVGTGKIAIDAARAAGRPAMHCRLRPDWLPEDLPDRIVERLAAWAAQHRVAMLNVVGPSDAREPGIGTLARALVGLVVERAAGVTMGPALAHAEAESDRLSGIALRGRPAMTEETLRAAADAIWRTGLPDGATLGSWDDTRRDAVGAPMRARLDLLERCGELIEAERPPTVDEARRLVDDFYAMDGNGCGGSLHIVLDDGNHEREHVEFCERYARERADDVGVAMARVLLAMGDVDRARLCGHSYDLPEQAAP